MRACRESAITVPLMVIAAVVAGAAAGCGGKQNPLGRQPIRGSVALDGKPLESGSIRFEPVDGRTMTGSYIKDGAFELPDENGLPVGAYKVSISSPWRDPSLPQPSPGEPSPPPIERVAPQFNIKSTLKVDIIDGQNDLTFEVQSASQG